MGKPWMQRFVNDTAALLEINAPEINIVAAFGSGTQMGGADPDRWAIAVREDLSDPDKLFSIAHEMRHLWQYVHAPEMFQVYQRNDQTDIIAYNRQPAELDANAFAAFAAECALKMRPLFQSMDDETKEMIWRRMREIEETI